MNAKKWYVSALEGVGRYAAGMLAAAGCLFLLAGCGGVGPEERAYPLTIFIDAVPEGYQVIYDMADLSEMTGQNKQGTAERMEEIRERSTRRELWMKF